MKHADSDGNTGLHLCLRGKATPIQGAQQVRHVWQHQINLLIASLMLRTFCYRDIFLCNWEPSELLMSTHMCTKHFFHNFQPLLHVNL